MSTKTPRWPNLGLEHHPALDWVGVEYTRKDLRGLADAVAEHHNPIRTPVKNAEGKVVRLRYLPDAQNLRLETLLRAFADNGKALAAMNARPALPPKALVRLNRAVHFHVRTIMTNDGKDAAYSDVANLWGQRPSAIRADVRAHKLPDGEVNDARRLAEWLIAHAEAKLPNSPTRRDAAAAVYYDMNERAKPYRIARKSVPKS